MAAQVAHLLVDGRAVDHPTARGRGIGRYTTGLLRGLVAIDAPVTALCAGDGDAGLLADDVPGLELRRWNPQAVRDHARPGTWFVATQLLLHPIPLDPVPAAVTEAGLPVAAVLYDVIPYRFPTTHQARHRDRALYALRAQLARTLDVLVTISEFSARTGAEELEFPARRVRTIGAGADPHFVDRATGPEPWPDRIVPADTPYVVSVSSEDEPRRPDQRRPDTGLLKMGVFWSAFAGAFVGVVAAYALMTLALAEVMARFFPD